MGLGLLVVGHPCEGAGGEGGDTIARGGGERFPPSTYLHFPVFPDQVVSSASEQTYLSFVLSVRVQSREMVLSHSPTAAAQNQEPEKPIKLRAHTQKAQNIKNRCTQSSKHWKKESKPCTEPEVLKNNKLRT